jgi:hypothetical protein
MTKPTLFGIINRGYFPKELPPAFNTRSFARVAKNPSVLPSEFTHPVKLTKNINHSLLSRADSRRRLGIINPVDYVALSKNVVDNWKQLSSIFNKSHVSLTSPVFYGPPSRSFGYKYAYNRIDDRKAMVRSSSKYLLRADISQFYHSVYTHSIAWAIHGKRFAKANQKNVNLLGNVLDKSIRHSQDNQTIGIPIGPDTSLLMAELILSACDERLQKKKIACFTRYIDDYEFGCKSLQAAESYRDALHELLSEFELVLNPDKTKIIELPVALELPCISAVRTFDIPNGSSQRYALISLFDMVFENVGLNPDSPLLKYLLGKLGNVTIKESNWTLYENLLLQCVMSDPSTINYVLREFLTYQSLQYRLDLSHINDVMNTLIKSHAPINHGSEVAWALWAQIVLNIQIDDSAAKAAIKMNDSIVAILLLDANSKNLIHPTINLTRYQSLMTRDDLYGEHWLLSYEANVKNWLPFTGGADYVNADRCFGLLKTSSVEFYDDKWFIKNKPRKRIPTPPIPHGGGGGGGTY